MERANKGSGEADLAIGLSSGTSMDGIDAALVRLEAEPGGDVELVAFETFPFDSALSDALREAADGLSPVQWALLDAAVGEAFARAASNLMQQAGIEASMVRCVGSHGQTLAHAPQPVSCAGSFNRATLQIGSAAVIAERTGITTVADFRSRDLAAGGQGAPLVPLLDHWLYRHPSLGRVLLNVGGIANVTALAPAADLGSILAFDTGPGNVLLDAAARRREISPGYDANGETAATGTADARHLERLLEDPYYGRRPPKSADTSDFRTERTDATLSDTELSDADLLATFTELTARTVAEAVAAFVQPRQPVDEVLVSGGGAHNRTLLRRIRKLVAPAELLRVEEVVPEVPGDAKEAVAFALLARETLEGRPGNVPSATGAAGPRVLGTIVPGV